MHQRGVLAWWAGAVAVLGLLVVGGPLAHLLTSPPPALVAEALPAQPGTTPVGEVAALPAAGASPGVGVGSSARRGTASGSAAPLGSDGGTSAPQPSAAPTSGVGRTWLQGSALSQRIGGYSYRWFDDGHIEPDPAWVRANIRTEAVPILGQVTCHRLVISQLRAALTEIQREGLAPLIRPDEYAGCYNPRFIDRDPSRPLSLHAFGIAFDLNTRTNALGTAGDMDPRIVAIMQRWGFAWGGYWTSRPDPMHFELYALKG